MWLEEVYEQNKKLDIEFIHKYGANLESMRDKNILSLLVEIGELANETRCFKYWSVKGPSPKEVILEEYADVVTMVLCFCNYLHANIQNTVSDLMYRTLDLQFLELYQSVSEFRHDYTASKIETILSKVLVLGHSLEFTDQDMKKACFRKMGIVQERLESNY